MRYERMEECPYHLETLGFKRVYRTRPPAEMTQLHRVGGEERGLRSRGEPAARECVWQLYCNKGLSKRCVDGAKVDCNHIRGMPESVLGATMPRRSPLYEKC